METARRFALNVREAIQGRSLREIGSLAGVNHSTIVAIVDGRVWPDLATIAKLEQGLDRSLYPARGQG